MNIDKITPKSDAVFKMIFTDPRHKRLLIHFLNCAIDSKDPIKDVKILNSELTKKHVTQKGSRLDIRAKTDSNIEINIEVQVGKEDHMMGRSLFYWSKMFAGSLIVKENYGKLRRTVSINILDFNLFEKDNRYYRKLYITDGETNERATDLLELQFLELNKMKKYTKESPITFWIEFFRDPYSEACQELYKFVPEIKEAKDIYEEAKSNPKKRRILEEREDAVRNYAAGLSAAREEGEAKGKAEEKIETVKNALAMNLSLEQISKLCGLTVDEIKSLQMNKMDK